jgi:hypothetical protein
MEDVSILYGHLEYFTVICFIWYILPVLVCCTKRNLATLIGTQFEDDSMQLQETKQALLNGPLPVTPYLFPSEDKRLFS